MSATRTLRHLALPPTAVSLRRWLCSWLALLILTQMIGSTLSGLHGSWHRHRTTTPSSAPSVPVIHWTHGDATAADAHARLHQRGETHDHAATDASVLPVGVDSAADAVAQLATALAPGSDGPWCTHDCMRHVQAGSARWAPTTRSSAPPLKPPRG